MDKFVIEMWNTSKQHLQSLGHDVSSKGIKKVFRQNTYSGRIEYVNTGEIIFFRDVVDMLDFIRSHKRI